MKLQSNIFDEFIKPYSFRNTLKGSNPMAAFVVTSLRWNKNYLMAFLDNHLIHYPTPVNLTYAWSFGSSAGICLCAIAFSFFVNLHNYA